MRPGVVPRLGPLAARRVLWVAALFLIPVPYWAIEVERAPVARLVLLAAVTGAAMLAEPGGVGSIVGGALVAQAILWLVVWAVVAWFVERRLRASWRAPVVALIVVALLVIALLPVYHVPFARTGPRVNLLGIFQ
jgi:hypothetical protein